VRRWTRRPSPKDPHGEDGDEAHHDERGERLDERKAAARAVSGSARTHGRSHGEMTTSNRPPSPSIASGPPRAAPVGAKRTTVPASESEAGAPSPARGSTPRESVSRLPSGADAVIR
jgi:hypothetical protein